MRWKIFKRSFHLRRGRRIRMLRVELPRTTERMTMTKTAPTVSKSDAKHSDQGDEHQKHINKLNEEAENELIITVTLYKMSVL